MSEMLLQSHHGTLRFCSALPEKLDAQFADLRAEGPTLVSAARENGRVKFVRLKALTPVTWKPRNPWPNQPVFRKAGRTVRRVAGDILDLKLARDEEIVLAQTRPALTGKLRPRRNQPAQPRCLKFPDGMLCWVGKPAPSMYDASLEAARRGPR